MVKISPSLLTFHYRRAGRSRWTELDRRAAARPAAAVDGADLRCCTLHRAAVRDDEVLRTTRPRRLSENARDCLDLLRIKRGIDFVEDEDGAGKAGVESEGKGEGAEGLLPTGEEAEGAGRGDVKEGGRGKFLTLRLSRGLVAKLRSSNS